jgi:hypothetical protein
MHFSGAVTIQSSWPSLGAVKGWCTGVQRSFFVVVLEHREVDHPQRRPAVFEQAVLLAEFAVADLDAQAPMASLTIFRLVGTEEHQVAVLRAGALQHGVEGSVVDVLDDGLCRPSRPLARSLTRM